MFANSVTGEALKCLLDALAVLPEALLMWTAGTQRVLPQQAPYRIHVWSQMLGAKTLWGMLNPDR